MIGFLAGKLLQHSSVDNVPAQRELGVRLSIYTMVDGENMNKG